jgi:hypothetical protein
MLTSNTLGYFCNVSLGTAYNQSEKAMAINIFKSSVCAVLKSDFTGSSSSNRTIDLPYHGFVEKDQVRWRDMPSQYHR